MPYVLEIWPGGNGSPIHNHGGACAIIKVLFGCLSVNLFNKLKQARHAVFCRVVSHTPTVGHKHVLLLDAHL